MATCNRLEQREMVPGGQRLNTIEEQTLLFASVNEDLLYRIVSISRELFFYVVHILNFHLFQ